MKVSIIRRGPIHHGPIKATYRNKFASFNGCHNRSRALCYLALIECKARKGLSCHELANVSGVPYGSVATLLKGWAKWGFVSRSCAWDVKGRLVYHYRIAKRGRRWIKKHLPLMPLARYLEEVEKNPE